MITPQHPRMITPDAARLRGDLAGGQAVKRNDCRESEAARGKGFATGREGQLFADADITKPRTYQESPE